MKQLRFTTTLPYSFFGRSEVSEPLVIPADTGELFISLLKGSTAYIHGPAEGLAGFDVPVFLDGDMAQLDQPADKQDILMLLPSGEYQMLAENHPDGVFASRTQYLLVLKDPLPLAVPKEEKPLEGTYAYPCIECENNELWPIPDHPGISECSKCGHPQDTPTPIQIAEFARQLETKSA